MAEAESTVSSVEHPNEGPNQHHLKDVHKSYRVIEKSRQNYHNESESILRRQEALLQTLNNDNRILQEKVDSYMLPDYTREASEMQAAADKFSFMIDGASKKLQSMERSLQAATDNMHAAKRAMGSISPAREKHRLAVIRGAVTENKLHNTMLKVNTVENQNLAMKRLMTEITTEREFQDKVKENMERDLHKLEQDTNERINDTKYLYVQRNDFEERITDIHEIATDMAAYNLWRETEGWAIMDPEPLAKVINPAEHPTGVRTKQPEECSAKERSWIELKALALIQDIFNVNECNDVVACVRQAQAHNNALFDQVNEYLKAIADFEEKSTFNEVKIDTTADVSKSVMINRKLDMEETLEGILDLLKDLNLSEHELMPIIRQMRRQLCAAFKEAGCNVEDDEVDYSEDSVATVIYKSGKTQPLDVAIVEFFMTVEHFVEQLSGFKH